jgi:hypothetical protein
MNKKQQKAFVKDTLKITKFLVNKMIEKKQSEENLFNEIRYCLKVVELRVSEGRK